MYLTQDVIQEKATSFSICKPIQSYFSLEDAGQHSHITLNTQANLELHLIQDASQVKGRVSFKM